MMRGKKVGQDWDGVVVPWMDCKMAKNNSKKVKFTY